MFASSGWRERRGATEAATSSRGGVELSAARFWTRRVTWRVIDDAAPRTHRLPPYHRRRKVRVRPMHIVTRSV